MHKLIAVIGPTASGKSELAVKLAQKYNGEIISADSRQVYRGMDIGSGKIEGAFRGGIYMYKRIAHYGIDIASPRSQYSVAQFQKYAKKVIADIAGRGKVPIICGGTGHWVDAVINDQRLPAVKPNITLRKQLEKKSVAELFAELKKLDPARAKNIDPNNPRRLIRALEIVLTTGKPVPTLAKGNPWQPRYDALWIGIVINQEILNKKIDKRFTGWLKNGMLEEIKKLHSKGVSWKRFEEFGLEYKYGALYIRKMINHTTMIQLSSQSIKQYAKRQLTWFKRNKDIHWIKNISEASKLTKNFLGK